MTSIFLVDCYFNMADLHTRPCEDDESYMELVVHPKYQREHKDLSSDKKTDIDCNDTRFKWCSTMFTVIIISIIIMIGLVSILNKDTSKERMTCSEGWYRYGRSCYFFVTQIHRFWRGAQDYCLGLGAYLTEISTADENRFITSNLVADSGHEDEDRNYWIGGTDDGHEGQWQWKPSGTFLTWTNWQSNSGPQRNNTNKNCLEIVSLQEQKGYWTDDRCDGMLHFICEKQVSSS